MTTRSVNERLQDATVSHAVDLQQYTNGLVSRIVALLNRADADLMARLQAALDGLPASQATVERLESLLASVRALNLAAYQVIERELTAELRALAAYEAGHQLQLFEATIPPQVVTRVGVAAVNVEQVFAAAMARPFQGRLLREWAADIGEARMVRIRDAVRMGFVQQESISQIVQRIRGTRVRAYKDGLLEIDRRGAEAVVRTAVSHTAGFVRDRFYEGNGDLVKAQTWTSTLDTRTSEECRVRDGKQYEPASPYKPIGHRMPWLGGPGRAHWGCRSTAVPVVKSWAELGLAIDEAPASTRASMDGQVPEETTFAAWIKRQSAERQDQVLGPTRGRLMRAGGMALPDFYDNKGTYLSLEELRRRDAAAFRRAGL